MQTEIHKISANSYLYHLISLWCKRNWWYIAITELAFIIAGLVLDIRYILVALILTVFIIPTLMMFIHIYYGLSDEVRFAIIPHFLSMSEKGITITFEAYDEYSIIPGPYTLPWNEITSVSYRSSAMLYHLSGSHYKIIVVPYSAFASSDSLRQWSKEFQSHHKNHTTTTAR